MVRNSTSLTLDACFKALFNIESPLRFGPLTLEPAQKALLHDKHVLGFVAELGNELVPRLGEPRNLVRFATILLFVSAFPAPIVDFHTTLLPIAHHVPLNGFIRPENLARPEARIAPEFRDLVEARKNSRRDALALGIASAQQ